MATFEIQGADGKVYEIQAPDQNSAIAAFQSMEQQQQPQPQPQSETQPEPQADMSFWGRLKDNVVGVDDGVESTGEYLAGMLNAGGQGLSFGLGDEMGAAVRTPFNEQSYGENLQENRQQYAGFKEAHPVASTTAEIGGAILPMAFGVGAAGNTIRGSAMVGSGQGALHGFGNGEGGLGNRAKNAAVGGVLGAGIGAAVPAAANGVRNVIQNRAMQRAINDAAKNAPTSEQLRAAGNAAYQRIDDAGVQIKPSVFNQARENIGNRLNAETGFDNLPGPGSLTPNSARVMQIMDDASGIMASEPRAALPFQSLDKMRRQAGAAAGNVANKSDQQAGSTIIDGLDDFVNRLGPDDVVAGDTAALNRAIPEAREIWGRMRRSQQIDDAIAQEGNYVSGGASAIRNQFASILRNPRLSRGYSEAEKAAMRRVVNGTPLERTVNLLGGGVGNITQMGAGFATGGPLGAMVGAGTSALSRRMSEHIVRKNAERARAAIASGHLNNLPELPQSSAIQQLLVDMVRRGGNSAAN